MKNICFVLLITCIQLKVNIFCESSELYQYLNSLNSIYNSQHNLEIEYYYETSADLSEIFTSNNGIYAIGKCKSIISIDKMRVERNQFSDTKLNSIEAHRSGYLAQKHTMNQLEIITKTITYIKPLNDGNFGDVKTIHNDKHLSILEQDQSRYPIFYLKSFCDLLHSTEFKVNDPLLVTTENGISEYFIVFEPMLRPDYFTDDMSFYERLYIDENLDEPFFRKLEYGIYSKNKNFEKLLTVISVTPDPNCILGYSSFTLDNYKSGKITRSKIVNIYSAKEGVRILPEHFNLLLKKGNKFIDLSDNDSGSNEIIADETIVIEPR